MFSTLWMALLVAPQLALANDEDEAACLGLAEGAACVRHNGDAGTCQPDDSDPGVLSCDDDVPAGGGSGGGGTSTGGGDTGATGSGGECDGLSVGDACIRDDGDAGWCKPDASDPGQLECDDDPVNTGGSGSTGTTTGGTTGGSGSTGTTGGGTTGGTSGGTTTGGTTGTSTGTGTPTTGSDAGCGGLASGDACVRDDGSAGVCQPDASDPTVLECDDDGLVSARSVAGCSAVDGGAAGWLALGGLGLIIRRRRA